VVWVDGLVLAAVGLGAYRGYKTGVLRQAVSILGWFVGFMLALQLMDTAGQALEASLPVDERLAPVVGFVLVLVAVRLGLFLLRQAFESILDAFHLSFLNRAGGSVVGAFQGVLVASLLFLVLGALGMPSEATRRASASYAPVAEALPQTWDAVAEHVPPLRTAAEQFGQRVQEEL
jgi:membrane protein required for colicin V production